MNAILKNPIRVIEGNAKPFEPFWQVRNATETGGTPEIIFYGFISEYSWMGDEITPKKFREDLNNIGKGGPILIHIHSGGGELFAAAAIRAMLLDYPGEITVRIDGLAASAAVAIALTGKKIQIYDTAYMMVHNPGYSFLMGYLDADVLQKMSEELVRFKEGLLNAYETRTGLSREELSQMLDAETWMTAQEAVDFGFADEVLTGGGPIKNDLKKTVKNYINVPPALLNAAVEEQPVQASIPDAGTESENSEASQSAEQTAPVDGQAASAEAEESHLAQVRQAFLFRELEIAKLTIPRGEPIMNIRELMAAQAAKIDRARELATLADSESRDFTDEERAEYTAALAEAKTQGEKIAQIQTERAELQNVETLQAKLAEQKAEKPAPGAASKSMKRSEFQALNAEAQMAFSKVGGKIVDD